MAKRKTKRKPSDKQVIASYKKIVRVLMTLLEFREARIEKLEADIEFIQPTNPAKGC